MAGVPSLAFNTDDLPEGQGFEIWRQVMGEFYDVPAPEAGAGAFSASLTVWNIEGALLTAGSFTSQRFSRSAGRARRDGFDPYTILFHLNGAWRADTGERAIESAPGQVSMLDFARPVVSEVTQNDSVTLTLPRDALDAVLPARDLHGATMNGGRGQLLADFLVGLARRLPEVDQLQATHLAAACRDMVAACLAPTPENKARAEPQLHALLRHRARQAIDANLHRPAWGAEELRAALGVSRSVLYRLMARQGGVAAAIMSRRLSKAHRLLSHANGGPRVSDVAHRCGFTNAAHFSRAFRQAYGYAPSDAVGQRTAILAPRRHGGGSHDHLPFVAWINDLVR